MCTTFFFSSFTYSMKFSPKLQCVIFILLSFDTLRRFEVNDILWDNDKNPWLGLNCQKMFFLSKLQKNHIQLKYHFVIGSNLKGCSFSSFSLSMLNFSLVFFMHTFLFFAAFETILEELQHANIVLIVRWLMNIIIKSNFILINQKHFSDILRKNYVNFTSCKNSLWFGIW